MPHPVPERAAASDELNGDELDGDELDGDELDGDELDDAELAVADAVGTELIRLVRLVERSRAQYHAEHPDAVERATYHLLVHLVGAGPSRSGALAEAVHSDPSTISRQVAQLVRLGFVERTADPQDGRATLLAATTEGTRVFRQNRRLRNVWLAGAMHEWSDQDRHALAGLMGRFATGLERVKAGTAPGADAVGEGR